MCFKPASATAVAERSKPTRQVDFLKCSKPGPTMRAWLRFTSARLHSSWRFARPASVIFVPPRSKRQRIGQSPQVRHSGVADGRGGKVQTAEPSHVLDVSQPRVADARAAQGQLAKAAGPSNGLQAGARDLGVGQIEDYKFFQSANRPQSGVADASVAQTERLQCDEAAAVRHARVADSRLREVERFQIRQCFQHGQTGVGHAAASQPQMPQAALTPNAIQTGPDDASALQAERTDRIERTQTLQFGVADLRAGKRDLHLAVADQQRISPKQLGALEERAADDIDAAAELHHAGDGNFNPLDFPGRPAADSREEDRDEDQRPPPPAAAARLRGVL